LSEPGFLGFKDDRIGDSFNQFNEVMKLV